VDLGNHLLVWPVNGLDSSIFGAHYTGTIPLSAAQHAYFRSLGVVDYLGSVGIGVLNVVGVVKLFRLRKSAVSILSTSLALNAAFTLFNLLQGSFVQAIGGSGLVGALLGLILLASVFLYARRLRKDGVLN
jgi:hypothetical protein